ncbi:Enoyl-CoA hydratase/carnithine racemase [Streptomyces sp. Ncost-T6T-1]|uniref:enoyl-CoA hydratase/isomerase family protein n=1 Tax=Streptomyces sp. Ncost-T6T-1 TaxID=1100828 RepID=UPI000804A3D4|nr:enoyl-CoA hydratase/isomerase family protein [Streptomyces sp. Ncost-T6T-1]SBV03756.1 Enoyl-CoA hydratase/carnithine racemase [Streptomyces sp. Ncost-T6T-1]
MSSARELGLTTLRLEQDGRVLTAFYANPPLNLITTAFLKDLDRLTRAVDRDPTIGAVVLTSDLPGRFMIHVDAEELGSMVGLPLPRLPPGAVLPVWKASDRALGLPGGESVGERLGTLGAGMLWARRWKKSTLRMNRSGVVYLAAIGGPALAGGTEIALACDIRYAADDPAVVFGQSEILFGMLPGGGGTQRLARHIGTGRALEMILEGSPIGAVQALDYGLVQRLVPSDELLTRTQAAAARLATRPRGAVSAAKRLVYAATDRPLRRGLDHELASFIAAGTAETPKRVLPILARESKEHGETPLLANPRNWPDGGRLNDRSV